MRYAFGCLTFLLGGLLVGIYDIIQAKVNPGYIDQKQAIAESMDATRKFCRETRYTHPVDCVHFTLKSINELKDGWNISLQSIDKRRTDSMWIGRRGEYDSLGTENLDGEQPDGITENAPIGTQDPPHGMR